MSLHARLCSLAEWGMPFAGWYDDARDYIIDECIKQGWDEHEFINVMAVTSPRISVKRNWDVTVNLMAGGSEKKQGIILPSRIALAHYKKTGEIRGPKTEAFARALHGDTTALVLDTWMAKALGVPHAKVTQVGTMAWAKGLMTAVAEHHGLCMRDAQAAVWAGVCKSHGVTPGTLETAVIRTSQMGWEF